MCVFFFFFKQKTAYEMRISDWSSDVCSSDLIWGGQVRWTPEQPALRHVAQQAAPACRLRCRVNPDRWSGRYGHEKRKQGARRAAIMLAGRWERCRAKCLPQYTSRHQRPCNDRKGQKSCSPPSRECGFI